jgi:hypothetical protein
MVAPLDHSVPCSFARIVDAQLTRFTPICSGVCACFCSRPLNPLPPFRAGRRHDKYSGLWIQNVARLELACFRAHRASGIYRLHPLLQFRRPWGMRMSFSMALESVSSVRFQCFSSFPSATAVWLGCNLVGSGALDAHASRQSLSPGDARGRPCRPPRKTTWQQLWPRLLRRSKRAHGCSSRWRFCWRALTGMVRQRPRQRRRPQWRRRLCSAGRSSRPQRRRWRAQGRRGRQRR